MKAESVSSNFGGGEPLKSDGLRAMDVPVCDCNRDRT